MPQPDSLAPNAESLACSIIIPTKDKLEYLRPCIESLSRTQSQANYEILIVDNASEKPATREYLEQIARDEKVRVLPWDKPFNFSAINNYAAGQSNASVLCFLNNDVEVTDPEWLEKMLAVATRTDVGAVGCVLLYPDQKIQHAGIALDKKAIATHVALGEAEDYLQQAALHKPFSVVAVTAACMMIRRDLFLRHNGFNEENLAVSFNDVDLCLRLEEKGAPVVLHPAVKLVHHESVSRKSDQLSVNRQRALREYAYMRSRWEHRLCRCSYSSGIPQEWLDQVCIQDDLDNTIQRATAALYEEPKLQIEDSISQDPASAEGGLASQRARSFEELEDRFKALQAHTLRIEAAHQMIESSIFWRVTAPLRKLRDMLSPARMQHGTGSESPNKASNESARSAGTSSVRQTEGETVGQGFSKARFDRDAQRELKDFLENNQLLVFPAASQSKVTIALVFYNRAALSLLCLKSILKHVKLPYELVIIDNDSSDETEELLSRIEGATIKRNTENLGFVKAVNQAAELASGKYLLLLNNDAMLEEASIENAVQVLESDDQIGAVGARIKLLDGSLQEAGSIIWNDGACVGYGRGDDPQSPQYMFRRNVDYCSGAFLLFELALFRELDCFDEQFAPAYYEESDFCIRLQQLGYQIVYDPNVQISHYEFASSGGISGAGKLQQAHREVLCEKHPVYLSRKMENNPDNILRARSANDLPNVLVIDDRVPYPSLGAGYPRCSHILNSLARLPINLTFYPLLFPEDDWDEVYTLLAANIEVMLGHGRAGLLDFLKDRSGFYQTIMVSRVHNMEIFNQALSANSELLDGIEIIYDAEAVSAPREVLQRRFWGEHLSDEQARHMVEQELVQAKHADKVIAVSTQEAAIYHEHGIDNTTVLGHMLAVQATEKPFSKRRDLLFVGALRDEGSPNVDSLLWFLVNCLPLIEEKVPDIRLFVIGDNTVPSLSTVTKDNVIFTGRLDSISEYYNDCRVFIAPTRFAAGIPHKVHEAASMGLPSVTTTLLAQQLGWTNEEQLLCADTPEKFAECCVRLHSDEKLWQGIRESGLQAVERDCSVQVFQSQLQQLFDLSQSKS